VKTKAGFIPNMPTFLNTSLMAAVLTLSFAQPAAAQGGAVHEQSFSDSTSAGIVERYPPGSIRSVEHADRALTDVQQERARVEAEYTNEERACYPKFFVTSCVDAAKERRRHALAQIQQVEVEANAFKRRARVEERDKALAEKVPKAAPIIKPPKEAKGPKDGEAAVKENQASGEQSPIRSDGPKPASRGTATPDRAAQHNAKLEKLKEREAADTQKRAENVAAFERKAREAEQRQREVAEKKAEKERKRSAKASTAAPD